jgi:hypothetical protein
MDVLPWPTDLGLLREFLRADATPTSKLLAPGRYTLRIEPWDRRFAPRSVAVEIRAGETANVEVTLAFRR